MLKPSSIALKGLFVFIVGLLVTGGAGCSSVQVPQVTDTKSANLPVTSFRTRTIGSSVQGRPILATYLGEGDCTVLFMATIHGDEPAGTQVLLRLREKIDENPTLLAGKRLILVPQANPDGAASCMRSNANDIDLNRNFATGNRVDCKRYGTTALSEPEAVALKRLVDSEKPAYVVSIHQPLACIDYDGPGEELARLMGANCALEVKKLGSRPGSLGSYVGVELNVPIITLEMNEPKGPGPYDTDLLWQKYGRSLIAALQYEGN